MKAIILAVVVASLAGCAIPSEVAKRGQAASNVGVEAYKEGDYRMAEEMLLVALTSFEWDESEHPDVPLWVTTLANVYWETGENEKLLNLVEEHQAEADADMWFCRVLERRRYFSEAFHCYQDIGDQARAKRILRSYSVDETFFTSRSK